MRYLLDTNTCIQYLNGRSLRVAERVNALGENDACVCSIVVAELFFGAMKSRNPPQTIASQRQFLMLFPSLPFDDQSAQNYAIIRADLQSKGTPIGGNDLLIAAIAMTHNLILISHNLREFQRIADLAIEDWE